MRYVLCWISVVRAAMAGMAFAPSGSLRFRALHCVYALLLYCSASLADGRDLSLWYTAPAEDWEQQALPIGNGFMGAMIFGGTSTDRVQFNEKTLWSGGPGSKHGYDFGVPSRPLAGRVKAVARTLDERGEMQPEDVAQRLGRAPRGYGDYLNFGDLVLEFAPPTGAVTQYRRELNLQNAVARVEYTQAGVTFWREYFASYPDRVVAIRLGASKAGAVSFRAKLSVPQDRERVSVIAAKGRSQVSGIVPDNGLRFEAQVRVINQGGSRRELGGGQIGVVGADEAYIILAAATDYRQSYPTYRGADPHNVVNERMDSAASLTAVELHARHVADHRELFDRVSLDIGQQPSELPTDQLLAKYGSGSAQLDRWLEALYFQYGRYLLIASSRPGSLPANLQGVWNHSDRPPWNSDYHVNINLQMNYWLAYPTNLVESASPLLEFIESLVEPGRRAARQVMGADGWTVFLNTNIFGHAGLIAWPTAFWQPEGGAWLSQHLYEHYLFTHDEAFLRQRAWPVMREAARFWLSALHVEPRTNTLVVSPSYSPEHGAFSAGASMSQQIVWDLLTNTREAALRLGETGFAADVAAALAKLNPGLRIGSWGQLQEWRVDRDDKADTHRHVSHLFALHPGRQISPLTTPGFAQAAKVSLDARGDGGTGWSKAWKVNFWARLLDGDRAHKLLGEQLRFSTLGNLLDTHPPFQIDGNFGATAGIAEMLLQSHLGEIHILPALPSAWPAGNVRGLRSRGDVVVSIKWSGGVAREVSFNAAASGPLKVRASLLRRPCKLVNQRTGEVIAVRAQGDLATLLVEGATEYVLRPS